MTATAERNPRRVRVETLPVHPADADHRADNNADDFFPHEFRGEIVHHRLGTYTYTVIFLPPPLARTLPFTGARRLRISGEVGDIPFEAAWQPSKGRWYMMLSRSMLKDGGWALGDSVPVRFRVEPDTAVTVPPALQAALAADRRARATWTAATPGQQRAMAHRVGSAKTEPTLRKRLDEALALLRTGTAIYPRGPQRARSNSPKKPRSRRRRA